MPDSVQAATEAARRLDHLFPGYSLIIRLGEGAQGQVFLAHHHSTDRRVAIKVLSHAHIASDKQRERFLNEIEVVSQLRHPNIVSLVDYDIVEDTPYYVMSHIDGLDVAMACFCWNLGIDETLDLFLHICAGVSYAHKCGVIHRDLKPSNIIVENSTRQPCILDFGLSRRIAAHARLTEQFQVVGTLPYMSPEQTLGDRGDAISDVYSLGVVLFEMLTDGSPFDASSSHEALLARIRNDVPRSLRSVIRDHDAHRFAASSIGDDLEAIVRKALAKAPSERYASVAEFSEDILRYRAKRPVSARDKDGVAYQLLRIAQSNRRIVLILVALALSLCATVGTVLFARIERARSMRVARAANAAHQASSLINLGGVYRDDGRIEEAILEFESVIAIAATVQSEDPEILMATLKAHQRLAELHLGNGAAARAASHCAEAVALATRGNALYGTDEWLRAVGFAHRLQGRLLLLQDRVPDARAAFEQCRQVRETLVRKHPATLSLQAELASALRWIGKCLSLMDQPVAARDAYYQELQIREALVIQDPESGDFVIDLLFAYNRVAAWHLREAQLDVAEQWLMKLQHWADRYGPRLAHRQRDLDRVRDAARANLDLIADHRSSS